METNHFTVFDSWLKLFCPTCLTEADRTALSVKGAPEKEKFGSWLKFFCPTCLTEADRTALSVKGAPEKEKFGSWLKFLCPTCLTEEDCTREKRFLAEAFMSSGNCL
jgi:hypothetical protein